MIFVKEKVLNRIQEILVDSFFQLSLRLSFQLLSSDVLFYQMILQNDSPYPIYFSILI